MDVRKKKFSEYLTPIYSSLEKKSVYLAANKDDADDLLQDTLVKAYERFDKFKEDTNFRAWLCRIMVNLFIDDYRKVSRHPDRVRLDDMYALDMFLEMTQEQKNWEKNFEICEEVFNDEITDAISCLSKQYQKVIYLCDANNFSYAEISRFMNMPVGTIMSQIHRARKQIRAKLVKLAYYKEMAQSRD